MTRMALFGRVGLAVALVASVSAQTEDNGETVWAAVAYINNGETTPLAGDLNTVLTPEGAQQMMRQGTAFRARYLRNGVNSTEYKNVEKAYFENLNINVIDNSDLDIISQTFEWVNGGAMAFMQGLYPPESDSWDSNTGGSDIAHDYAEGDNVTNYPLNGYQYPNIQTYGSLDPQSVAIQGSLRCSAWQGAVRDNLTYDDALQNLFEDTFDFYQELFSTAPLVGSVGLDYANLWNAYLLYDYVNYMYIHNETVNENLKNATATIAKLESYAFILEHAKNSPQNSNGTDDPNNVLYTIAGRTLADRVAQAFLNNVQWNGERDMLTLMFGSYEPILSFLSISGLLDPTTLAQGPFSSLPEPGAALVFELYGRNPVDPSTQPTFDKLSVRFYYKANADNSTTFTLQPLFDSAGNGSFMSYMTFIQTMQDLGRSAEEWCDICGPTPAPWCVSSVSDDGGDSRSKNVIEPTVAGVLGAVIMLAIIAIIGGGLYAIGGYTLKQDPAEKSGNNSTNIVAGGFKGPEKKEGDKDVAVTRTGAHHERVGSWELRSGTDLPTTVTTVGVGAGIVTKDLPRARANSIDNDAISIVGATPVKAHETV
ncbi:Fc.00g007950.m01.CDS01 [Cosmosporella sp. VM-42]